MKEAQLSRVVNFRRPPEFHWHLGVVAKRTYRLHEGRCVPATIQLPLVGRVETESDDTGSRDEDDYPHKPLTDVILHGAAHTGGPNMSELVASVEVGPLSRRVRVHGDRTVAVVGGGLVRSFSTAGMFTSIPLSYARSYGGFDAHAAATVGDPVAELCASFGLDFRAASRFTYPRNSRGVGFFMMLDPDRMTGAVVPNLEDPEDPVLPERIACASMDRWYDQPIPGALDSLLMTDFPRSIFLNAGPDVPQPVPALRELTLGAIEAADLRSRAVLDPPDGRGANGAAPGLARVRLRGDEPAKLVHLHPAHRELTFRLPGDVPELRIQPPGCPALDLEAQLDTVYLEPDVDRVSLIWSGSLRVASRYPASELSSVQHFVRWP